MARDQAFDRVVGVIYWHLHHGGSAEEAMAKAQKRQPELSDSDFMLALDIARAQQSVVDVCQSMIGPVTVGDSVPTDFAGADLTMAEIHRRCGMPRGHAEE